MCHSRVVTSLAFSKEGALVSGSSDGTARVWNVATGAMERTINPTPTNHIIYGVAFVPRSNRIVTASDDGRARIWHPQTGVILRTIAHDMIPSGVATGVVFPEAPPGMADKADPAPLPLLAMGIGDGTVTVFRAN